MQVQQVTERWWHIQPADPLSSTGRLLPSSLRTGRRLGADSSDLDLVFLHDCPAEVMTDGERRLDAVGLPAAQRIMHLVSTRLHGIRSGRPAAPPAARRRDAGLADVNVICGKWPGRGKLRLVRAPAVQAPALLQAL